MHKLYVMDLNKDECKVLEYHKLEEAIEEGYRRNARNVKVFIVDEDGAIVGSNDYQEEKDV